MADGRLHVPPRVFTESWRDEPFGDGCLAGIDFRLGSVFGWDRCSAGMTASSWAGVLRREESLLDASRHEEAIRWNASRIEQKCLAIFERRYRRDCQGNRCGRSGWHGSRGGRINQQAVALTGLAVHFVVYFPEGFSCRISVPIPPETSTFILPRVRFDQ